MSTNRFPCKYSCLHTLQELTVFLEYPVSDVNRSASPKLFFLPLLDPDLFFGSFAPRSGRWSEKLIPTTSSSSSILNGLVRNPANL